MKRLIPLGTLCCIRESSKYLEVEISHLITDYKNNLSIKNLNFLIFLYCPIPLSLDWIEDLVQIYIKLLSGFVQKFRF